MSGLSIDSRRFRVRSTGFGTVEIRDMRTGATAYPSAQRVPSAEALGRMSEAMFEHTMLELMK